MNARPRAPGPNVSLGRTHWPGSWRHGPASLFPVRISTNVNLKKARDALSKRRADYGETPRSESAARKQAKNSAQMIPIT